MLNRISEKSVFSIMLGIWRNWPQGFVYLHFQVIAKGGFMVANIVS